MHRPSSISQRHSLQELLGRAIPVEPQLVRRPSPAILADWFVHSVGPPGGTTRRRRLRAIEARVVLSQISGIIQSPPRHHNLPFVHTACRQLLRLLTEFHHLMVGHGWLIVLVFVVLSAEARGLSSSLAQSAPPAFGVVESRYAATELMTVGVAQPALIASPADLTSLLSASSPDAIAPALREPRELVSAFSELHQLADNETLGVIAARYGISIESLIWSNGLDQGDALMAGQVLRIPRISGVPYTVIEGETIEEIAARFSVTAGAIIGFGPNRMLEGRLPPAGTEIFIPGATLALPTFIENGQPIDPAKRRVEPAGLVLAAESNLREGPSTAYPRMIQLTAGRRVALLGRHGDWLKVAIGGTGGWMRADLLSITSGVVERLPEVNDFPPPPPRWVWPTRGEISSGFGRRWGSFHNGIDITNRAWTPIVAARAGWVKEAGWCSGYGYCVKLQHEGGVETIYGHMIDDPVVSAGDEVGVGELIGYMGSTYDRAGGGYSTGVHLHFTITINGRAVNPLKFLP